VSKKIWVFSFNKFGHATNLVGNERHNRHYPKIPQKGMKIYDMKDDKDIGSQVEASLCDNYMHLIVLVCKTQRTKRFQG
jgi:hypothetical protein